MTTQPIQNALTALIPIYPKTANDMRQLLISNPIDPTQLDAVGTVHFARLFVMDENNPVGIPANTLCVITTYDGSFIDYIQDFVNQPSVAEFFDKLLEVTDVPGAADLIPVQKNAAGFAALIEKYDVTNPSKKWGEWYSAYPTLSVQQIWQSTKQKSAGQ